MPRTAGSFPSLAPYRVARRSRAHDEPRVPHRSPLNREQSAGLADQTDRWKYRSDCLQHILTEPGFSLDSSPEEEDVAVCKCL